MRRRVRINGRRAMGCPGVPEAFVELSLSLFPPLTDDDQLLGNRVVPDHRDVMLRRLRLSRYNSRWRRCLVVHG
jgi:hypothetical protein